MADPGQNQNIAVQDHCPILKLPTELLEHILNDSCLSAIDVCRIACVCVQLRDVASSNEVWRQKLGQRWPHLLAKYPRDRHYDWLEQFRVKHDCSSVVRRKVAALSPRFYNKDEVPTEGFAELAHILTQHQHASIFVIDALMGIVHDGNDCKNLTEKYYAEKALRFVQQQYLTREWESLLALPAEKQSLEKGALLIAQWCQPLQNVTYNYICDQLDKMAALVRREVKSSDSSHPLCNTASSTEYLELTECMWSPPQSRAVLEALNSVFYQQLGYRGNDEAYGHPHNSYINKVLELRTGIPITLCIVYMAVARRLGVVCLPVNFPGHFLIKWKEYPDLSDGLEYTYIDVFNGGKLMSETASRGRTRLPSHQQEHLKPATAKQVFERMARNLVHNARQRGQTGDSLLCLRTVVELFLAVCPDDVSTKLLLIRLYLHVNINLTEVMDMLQSMQGAEEGETPPAVVGYLTQAVQGQMEEERGKTEPEAIIPKTRAPDSNVLYSTGLVMKHKRYDYLCVISGWDATCEASREWILQMGVNQLPHKHLQPFYNVLVEDGSNRYAAQENLEMPDVGLLEMVSHPEIGKNFLEFTGRYFVANAEKHQEYPQDREWTERKAAEIYG